MNKSHCALWMATVAVIGLAVASGMSAKADSTQDCRNGPPDTRILGCSRLLAEASTPRQRAIALDGRCKAQNDRSAYLDALADCTSAIRADSAYPYSYSNRGIAHASLNNHDSAIQDFSRAHSLRPNFSWMLVNRAKSYAAIGNADLAASDYQQALLLKPDNEEAKSLLAVIRGNGTPQAGTTSSAASSSLCGNAGCR